LPELHEPWGFSLARKATVFHIVVAGTCWLAVEGLAVLQLSTGDFVLVPRGWAHILEDALTQEEKADGYVLACQARIQGDVTVDA
jgi:uncharacterized 2Fe-2S/4Fe-4S cluster protein (DUF4445 family)